MSVKLGAGLGDHGELSVPDDERGACMATDSMVSRLRPKVHSRRVYIFEGANISNESYDGSGKWCEDGEEQQGLEARSAV